LLWSSTSFSTSSLSIFAEKEEMLAHAVNIADFYWWTAIHQLVNFITCGLQYFPGCEPLHIRLVIFCSGMNIQPSSMSIDVAYLSNLPFSETKTCRV
jgi:hypothetical protein